MSSDAEHSAEMEQPTAPSLPSVAAGMLASLEENLVARARANAEGSGGKSANNVDSNPLDSSNPSMLGVEPTEVEDVLSDISNAIYNEAEDQLLLRLSDRTSLLSVVSHALAAYITTLEMAPLQRLSSRIASEVSLWMCKLFRFSDGAAFCHEDSREGLVRIARLALFKHCPKMANDGFEALFSRPPMIYLTSSTYQETMAFVCRQLGLPLSSLRLIKLPATSSTTTMETAIERMIQEDKASGRMPVLCIANVHSSIVQSVDVCAFEAVCRRNDVWLHLEGNALAALALLSEETKRPAPTGDSLAVTLGSWIGVPAVPFVTLYKVSGNETWQSMAGLSTPMPSVRLSCLPLWCVLRSLGERHVAERIESVFQLLEVLNAKLKELKCVRVLSQRTPEDKFVSVSELRAKNFDVSKIYRTVNPALAFQYVSESPPDLTCRVPLYFNNLNSWLGQTLQRDCSQIPLEIVDVETTGYVLRLCPFESLALSGSGLSDDDVAAFIESMETQTSILNATVVQREAFVQAVRAEPRLEHVEMVNWAGLGGIRYIPVELVDEPSTPEEGSRKPSSEQIDADEVRKRLESARSENRDLIDHRNIRVVQQLRSTDSAFSLGEGPDGRICIRFGMVSADTDVVELLQLVIKSGMQIDEQVSQLQSMSDVVRKGIEQAMGELQRESAEAIWQEGILRHVPLVGSFYNWISPAQKTQIKGRCLHLQEGKVESTEKIYKKQGSLDQSEVCDSPRSDIFEANNTKESVVLANNDNESHVEVTNGPIEAVNGDIDKKVEEAAIQA